MVDEYQDFSYLFDKLLKAVLFVCPQAGVFCVGMGSKLFPSDKVKAGDWQYVTDKCKEALGYVQKAKN